MVPKGEVDKGEEEEKKDEKEEKEEAKWGETRKEKE